MVEQIKISPEEVRGYGNVCEEHTLEDFTVNVSSLSKVSETVHGALTHTYKLLYSVYGLMFDFDIGAKQLYLQTNEANTLSLGFDTQNKQLYLVDENDTGFSLDFDEDTNELYITDDAPPIVHNYSLALDQSSYTTTGSLSVSATLLDNGVAVSGATISFTGGMSTVTATTNSSGVATATVNFTSSGTLTASYSNVSDTASVTVSHNYSLAFSSSSYVATDGSAEVSVTLLDDNVAVTGATISFTGGTSTVTGVTNSSGVATATVSVSATSTITATYNNVTDTCTVTVGPSYLFYDDCTSDRTSDYELLDVSGFRNSLATWSYDSTNNCYNLGTGSYQNANYGLLVKDLTVGSCKITAKVQVNTTNNVQIGVGLHNNDSTGVQIVSRLVKTNNSTSIIRVVPDTTLSNTSVTLSANTDYILEFTNDSGSLTYNLYNSSGTLLKTLTGTTNLLSSNNNTPFVFFGYQSQQNAKLKEFKVEAL